MKIKSVNCCEIGDEPVYHFNVLMIHCVNYPDINKNREIGTSGSEGLRVKQYETTHRNNTDDF